MHYKFLAYLLSRNRFTKRLIQGAIDITLIIGCYIVAMWLRLDSFHFVKDAHSWLILLLVIPTTTFAFYKLGLYRAIVRYISTKATKNICIGVGISAVVMLVMSQAFSWPVPRSVPIIYAILMASASGGIRFILRYMYILQTNQGRKPVAIYGAGKAGHQLLASLRQNSLYRPVIFVDDNPQLQNTEIADLTVYSSENLKDNLTIFQINTVLLAMPSVDLGRRKKIIERLEKIPVEVKTLPDINGLIEERVQSSDLRHVSIEELLGRDPVPLHEELEQKNIHQKTVLISGAGGSIGCELSRQILHLAPQKLLLLDISEYALYKIHQELSNIAQTKNIETSLVPLICSVQNKDRLLGTLKAFCIDTIYHAAAYKHVPLVEMNIIEGLQNNIFGTLNLAQCAIETGVSNFTLISTDKAVRPTNFMGASKRFAELICQALSKNQQTTCFSMVRFGNVLGSSGSVIPLFKKQIAQGGPVTVTDKDVTRFFMTIPEAAQLVIQAGAIAQGGDVFILEMGKSLKILDLAKKIIRLHGLIPYMEKEENPDGKDIPIKITGLRHGEKLHEELLIGANPKNTPYPRIMTAEEQYLPWDQLQPLLEQLLNALKDNDLQKVSHLMVTAPTEFTPTQKTNDLIWQQQNTSS